MNTRTPDTMDFAVAKGRLRDRMRWPNADILYFEVIKMCSKYTVMRFHQFVYEEGRVVHFRINHELVRLGIVKWHAQPELTIRVPYVGYNPAHHVCQGLDAVLEMRRETFRFEEL